MKMEYDPRRLDVKAFAEAAAELSGQERLGDHSRLMAETAGRGAETRLSWSVTGEMRNPAHVHPEIWLHVEADTVLSLTCQRCLAPVDVPVAVKRPFRFVQDEASAMAEDDHSEEDLLALSRSFDLIELVEDELLMDLPVAPRHEVCPVPVQLAVEDPGFEATPAPRENPFALLQRLKTRKGE
ncbi:YceD family protein [Caenimonas terrae]|uniref:Large ribosomal RNA subunit accumulation protein YceD n=1 Tax=Caenimonas terrae TaxID=696074 RepID=A0ABW0NHK9_9BURK